MKNKQKIINASAIIAFCTSCLKLKSLNRLTNCFYVRANLSLVIIIVSFPVISFAAQVQGPSGSYDFIEGKGTQLWTSGPITASLSAKAGEGEVNHIFDYAVFIDLFNLSDSMGYTSDGKYGLVIGDDVIMTYKSVSRVESASDPSYNFTVTSTDSGPAVAVGNVTIVENNLGAVIASNGVTTKASRPARNINWFLEVGLWAGPKAKSGTYSYGQIRYVLDGFQFPSEAFVISSGNFNIIAKPPLSSCSISAPPTIDFGVIHGLGIKENSFITQQTGNLTVNCSSDSQSTISSVKVQVLGERAPCCGYLLALKTDSGANSPGEIRGWINQPATETCSGYASATNGLEFGNSSKWFEAGELKVGTNLIPYVFNLCGSGSNKVSNLGPANATATINVSWD